MKKGKKTFLILIAIGAVFVPLMGWWQGLYTAKTATEVFKILCDCFFVPGFFFVLMGALIYCTDGGAFDMIGYSVKSVFGVLSSRKNGKAKESYYEYRERKHTERHLLAPFFLAGGIFIAVAVTLLILYYNV